MTLYSFKGHYPVEQIDNNKGWYEVPAKPEAPEGKEVRWENAEWVVRDPKPEDRPGYQWNWNHGEMAWVECEYPQTAEVVEPVEPVDPIEPFPSISISDLGTASISDIGSLTVSSSGAIEGGSLP
jgi:hypothetical protein